MSASRMTTTAYQELKQEVRHMKRRISALERAFDSIATKDDFQAIEEAHEDLKRHRTVSLVQIRKKEKKK